MIKLLRKHRKGLFGGVILGLVSLTMVGFGMDFFGNGQNSNVAITVGDTEISSIEYSRRLSQTRDRYRNQFGAQYEQIAKMLNLEQQTIDQLIDTRLMQELLDSLDLSASPREVAARIASHPYFQGRDVTQENYLNFARALGMTGAQLERITAQELAGQTVTNTLKDINVFSDQELQAVFKDNNREASFHYVAFSPSSFTEKVAIDDEEVLRSYYVDNAEQYRKPRAVKYNSVIFSPTQFMNEVDITEEDLHEYYERNKNKYVEEKKVTFRRILFKKDTAEKSPLEQMVSDSSENSVSDDLKKQAAEAALARIEAGEIFADLARELSEDASTKEDGGRVDWIEFRALKPEIRKALSSLEIGENSNVVTTDEGYYLLLVDGLQDKRFKELDEVKPLVEQALRREYAPEYASAAAENFYQLFKEEQAKNRELDLKAFAELNNRAVTIGSEPLSRGQAGAGVAANVTNVALGLSEGDTELLDSGADSVIIQVSSVTQSYIPEFEEVKSRVENDFRLQESAVLAKKHAEDNLQKLLASEPTKASEVLTQIAQEQGGELKESASGSRMAIQDPIIAQPDVKRVAFSLSKKNPIAKEVIEANGSYLLLALADETMKESEDFSKKRIELTQTETQRAARRLEEVLIKQLRSETQVWVDPNLLDEANG